MGKTLGSGTFGEVKQVFNKKSNEARAMKIISKKNISSIEDQKKLISEIEILKHLDVIIKMNNFYF